MNKKQLLQFVKQDPNFQSFEFCGVWWFLYYGDIVYHSGPQPPDYLAMKIPLRSMDDTPVCIISDFVDVFERELKDFINNPFLNCVAPEWKQEYLGKFVP